MPVAHQPPPAIIGKLVGMAAEQARHLGLNRLRQKRSRAVAQNLGQRIGKSSWLRELENISLSHGVSLLRWRSGGLEHPHDTPPYPFTPSPTFAHSSFPWLVNLMSPAYRVYLVMAVTILFNVLKAFSRFRLWRIDAAREKLETALKQLVDPVLTHAQMRAVPAERLMAVAERRATAEAIMERLVELRARCQR